MLATLNEVLEIARKNGNAVGSFNTPNLSSIWAVIDAAEKLNQPVVIMHAQCHDQFVPIDVVGPAMIALAKKAKVPVCVHLDHGESVEYSNHAVDLGFTSVMYDGSADPFEKNVADTYAAVRYAHAKGVSVEAELGVPGKREMGAGHENEVYHNANAEEIYTDPDQAAIFVEKTHVDALAVSFGTAHGLYLKKPQLDMSVLDNIGKRTDVPLVMHGGSGISKEDFETSIRKGIRKVNYYTYMAKAGGEAVVDLVKKANGNIVYYHDVSYQAKVAMEQNVSDAIRMFALMK